MKSMWNTRIVIYDLEFTAWEGSVARDWSGPGEYREIVQIGAVAVDGSCGFQEFGSFEALVRPRINPVLSEYFVALTGISAEDALSRGQDIADALLNFRDFVGGQDVPMLSFGPDFRIIAENCALFGLPYPFDPARTIDIAPRICECARLDRSEAMSSSLPELMGFPAQGPKHEALSDARCVAEALRRLRVQGLI